MKRFHDDLLSHGTIPTKLVGEEMLKGGGGGAYDPVPLNTTPKVRASTYRSSHGDQFLT